MEKKGGILVSLDFNKAFHTLEWQFVMKILELFNFGENVKKWVRIFYANIESAVMYNCFATNWFKPTRGVSLHNWGRNIIEQTSSDSANQRD